VVYGIEELKVESKKPAVTQVRFWFMQPAEVESALVAVAADGREQSLGVTWGVTEAVTEPNQRRDLVGWARMEVAGFKLRTRTRAWAVFMGFATKPSASSKAEAGQPEPAGLPKFLLSNAIREFDLRIATTETKVLEKSAGAGTYSVSLPNGFSAEVVAVCRNPRNSNVWWRPDGSRFDVAPYRIEKIEPIGPTRGQNVTVKPENEVLLVVKFAGHHSEGIGMGWNPQPSDVEFAPTLVETATGNKISGSLICYDEMPPTVTYTASVSSRDWEPVATFDGEQTRELINGIMVNFSKPVEEPGKSYTRFDVMHNIDRERYDMRLMARLTNGREVDVDFHSGVLTGTPAKGFALIHKGDDLVPSEVQEYVLQRSLLMRGTIPDIALRPLASAGGDTPAGETLEGADDAGSTSPQPQAGYGAWQVGGVAMVAVDEPTNLPSPSHGAAFQPAPLHATR